MKLDDAINLLKKLNHLSFDSRFEELTSQKNEKKKILIDFIKNNSSSFKNAFLEIQKEVVNIYLKEVRIGKDESFQNDGTVLLVKDKIFYFNKGFMSQKDLTDDMGYDQKYIHIKRIIEDICNFDDVEILKKEDKSLSNVSLKYKDKIYNKKDLLKQITKKYLNLAYDNMNIPFEKEAFLSKCMDENIIIPGGNDYTELMFNNIVDIMANNSSVIFAMQNKEHSFSEYVDIVNIINYENLKFKNSYYDYSIYKDSATEEDFYIQVLSEYMRFTYNNSYLKNNLNERDPFYSIIKSFEDMFKNIKKNIEEVENNRVNEFIKDNLSNNHDMDFILFMQESFDFFNPSIVNLNKKLNDLNVKLNIPKLKKVLDGKDDKKLSFVFTEMIEIINNKKLLDNDIADNALHYVIKSFFNDKGDFLCFNFRDYIKKDGYHYITKENLHNYYDNFTTLNSYYNHDENDVSGFIEYYFDIKKYLLLTGLNAENYTKMDVNTQIIIINTLLNKDIELDEKKELVIVLLKELDIDFFINLRVNSNVLNSNDIYKNTAFNILEYNFFKMEKDDFLKHVDLLSSLLITQQEDVVFMLKDVLNTHIENGFNLFVNSIFMPERITSIIEDRYYIGDNSDEVLLNKKNEDIKSVRPLDIAILSLCSIEMIDMLVKEKAYARISSIPTMLALYYVRAGEIVINNNYGLNGEGDSLQQRKYFMDLIEYTNKKYDVLYNDACSSYLIQFCSDDKGKKIASEVLGLSEEYINHVYMIREFREAVRDKNIEKIKKMIVDNDLYLSSTRYEFEEINEIIRKKLKEGNEFLEIALKETVLDIVMYAFNDNSKVIKKENIINGFENIKLILDVFAECSRDDYDKVDGMLGNNAQAYFIKNYFKPGCFDEYIEKNIRLGNSYLTGDDNYTAKKTNGIHINNFLDLVHSEYLKGYLFKLEKDIEKNILNSIANSNNKSNYQKNRM